MNLTMLELRFIRETCLIVINRSMNNLQEKQLHIFQIFYELCNENDIPIFLAFGSAIGALRHQGFIPWDDDLDVFIFANDRQKVIDLCLKHLPQTLFYQTPSSDCKYRLAIDRVRLNTSTLIEETEQDRDINHGIFIDIYPLYRCSDSRFGYVAQYLTAYIYRSILYGRASRKSSISKRFIQSFVDTVTPRFVKRLVLEKSFNFISNMDGTRYLSTFYGDEVNLRYPIEWFQENREVKFENIQASVAKNVEACLTMEYGNYMNLPPLHKQIPHHDYVFLDCFTSYSEYRGVQYMTEKK